MEESERYICPICGKKLTVDGRSYFCENSHCFDVSKNGYVNLLLANQKNSIDPGDNKEMILARVKVMQRDYYRALADAIIFVLRMGEHDCIVDAGCGVGYIPYRLKNEFEASEVIGMDISKSAITQASKHYKGVNYAVASSMRLPLESECADAVICAFAPVYAEEFLRITKKGGKFFRVVPAANHLLQLKAFLYDNPRLNETDEVFIEGYKFVDKIFVKDEFCGDKDEIAALVKMTPYYYHTSQEILSKLEGIEAFTTNIEFELRIYEKI